MALDDTTREVQEKPAEQKTLRPGSETAITSNSDNQLAIELKAHKGEDNSVQVLQGPKGEDFKIAEGGQANTEQAVVPTEASVKVEHGAGTLELAKSPEPAVVANAEAVKNPELAVVANAEAVKNAELAVVASAEAVKSPEQAVVASAEAVKNQEQAIVASAEAVKNPEQAIVASAEAVKNQEQVVVASAEPVKSSEQAVVASAEPVKNPEQAIVANAEAVKNQEQVVVASVEPVKSPEQAVVVTQGTVENSPEVQAAVLRNLQLAMTEHLKAGTDSFLPAADKPGVAGDLSSISPPPLANPLLASDLQTQVIATDVVVHPNQPLRDAAGHVTTVVDAQGRQTTIAYDGQGSPAEIHLPQGVLAKGVDGLWTGSHGETYKDLKVNQESAAITAFSANGDVTLFNSNGTRAVYRSDDTGFNYNAGGQLVSVDRSIGGTRDANGLPSLDNRRETSSFVYDTDGTLAGVKTVKGAFSLDANGQVLVQHGRDFSGSPAPESSFNKVSVDAASGVVTLEKTSNVTAGASYKEVYYPNGASEIRKADGSSIVRNTDGSLSTVTDNQGQVLKFDYQAGQVSRIVTSTSEWNVREGKVVDANGATVGDKVTVARDGVVTFVDSNKNTNTIHPDGSRTVNDQNALRDLKFDASGHLRSTNEWADGSKTTFKYGADGKVVEVALKDGNWKRDSEIDANTGVASWVNQESGKKVAGVVNLEAGTFKTSADSPISADGRAVATVVSGHGDGGKVADLATVSVLPNRIETPGLVLEKASDGNWNRAVVNADGSLTSDKNFSFKGDIKVDANTSNQLWLSADGRYTSLKFPNGDYTDFYKGEDGRFSKIISVREGVKTEHAYNGTGTVNLNTRGVPEITDDRGRITALEAPGKWSTRDASGNLLGVSDGKAIYKFDETGNVKSVSAGRAILERDESGTWQRYTLDDNKQKVVDASYKGFVGKLEVNPTTYVQTWSSNDGRQVTVKEPQGRTIDSIYAEGGVLQKKIVAEPDGSKLVSNFNSQGTLLNVISKDSSGQTVAVSDSQQRRMTLAYDGQGNVATITDTRGVSQVLEPGQKAAVQANGSVVIADSRNNSEITVRPDGRTLVNPESGSKIVLNPDGEVKYVSLRTPTNLEKVVSAQPVSNKPEAVINKAEIVSSKPEAVINKAEIVSSKPDAVLNKADVVSIKPEAVINKAEVVINKPEVVISKTEVASSKPEAVINKTEVASSKPEAVINKAEVVSNKPEAVINKTEVVISKNEVPPAPTASSIGTVSSNLAGREVSVVNNIPVDAQATLQAQNKQLSRDAQLVASTGEKATTDKSLEVVSSLSKPDALVRPSESGLQSNPQSIPQANNQVGIVRDIAASSNVLPGAPSYSLPRDNGSLAAGDSVAAIAKLQELKRLEMAATNGGILPPPIHKDAASEPVVKDNTQSAAIKMELPPLANVGKFDVVVNTSAPKIEVAGNNVINTQVVKPEIVARDAVGNAAAVKPLDNNTTLAKVDSVVKLPESVLPSGNPTLAQVGNQGIIPVVKGDASTPLSALPGKDGVVADSASTQARAQELKTAEAMANVMAAMILNDAKNRAQEAAATSAKTENSPTQVKDTNVAGAATPAPKELSQEVVIKDGSQINSVKVELPPLANPNAGISELPVAAVNSVTPVKPVDAVVPATSNSAVKGDVLAKEATPPVVISQPVGLGKPAETGSISNQSDATAKTDVIGIVPVNAAAGQTITQVARGDGGITPPPNAPSVIVRDGVVFATTDSATAGKNQDTRANEVNALIVAALLSEAAKNAAASKDYVTSPAPPAKIEADPVVKDTTSRDSVAIKEPIAPNYSVVTPIAAPEPVIAKDGSKGEFSVSPATSAKPDVILAREATSALVPGDSATHLKPGETKIELGSGLVAGVKPDATIGIVPTGKPELPGGTVVAGKLEPTVNIIPSVKPEIPSVVVATAKPDTTIAIVPGLKPELPPGAVVAGKLEATTSIVPGAKPETPIVVGDGKSDTTITAVPGVKPEGGLKDGIIITASSQVGTDVNLNTVPIKNADAANYIAANLFKEIFFGGSSNKEVSSSSSSGSTGREGDSSKPVVADSSAKSVAPVVPPSQYVEASKTTPREAELAALKPTTSQEAPKAPEKSTFVADAGYSASGGSGKDIGSTLARDAYSSGLGNVTRLESTNVAIGGSLAKDAGFGKTEDTLKKGDFVSGGKLEVAQEGKSGLDSKFTVADSSSKSIVSAPQIVASSSGSSINEGGKTGKEVVAGDSHGLSSASSAILARDSAQSGGALNVAKLDGFLGGVSGLKGEAATGKVDALAGKSEVSAGKVEGLGGKSEVSAGKVDGLGSKSELSGGKPEFLADAGKQIVDVSAKQSVDGTKVISVPSAHMPAAGVLGESVKAAPAQEVRGVVNPGSTVPILARDSSGAGNLDVKPLPESNKSAVVSGGSGTGTAAASSTGMATGNNAAGSNTSVAQSNANANSGMVQGTAGLPQQGQQTAGQGNQPNTPAPALALGQTANQTGAQAGNQNTGLPASSAVTPPMVVACAQGHTGQQLAQQSNSGVIPSVLPTATPAIPSASGGAGTAVANSTNNDPSSGTNSHVAVNQGVGSVNTSLPTNLGTGSTIISSSANQGAGTQLTQQSSNLPAGTVQTQLAQQAVSSGSSLSGVAPVVNTASSASANSLPGSTAMPTVVVASQVPAQSTLPTASVTSSTASGQNSGVSTPDPSSGSTPAQVIVSTSQGAGLPSSSGNLSSMPAGSLPATNLAGQTATTGQGGISQALAGGSAQPSQVNQQALGQSSGNAMPVVSMATAVPAGVNAQGAPQVPNMPNVVAGAGNTPVTLSGNNASSDPFSNLPSSAQLTQQANGALPVVHPASNPSNHSSHSNTSSSDPSGISPSSPQLAQQSSVALPTVLPGLPNAQAAGVAHNLTVANSQASPTGALPALVNMPGGLNGLPVQANGGNDNLPAIVGSNILAGSSFSNAQGSGNLSFAAPPAAESAGGHSFASFFGTHALEASTSSAANSAQTPSFSVAKAETPALASLPANAKEPIGSGSSVNSSVLASTTLPSQASSSLISSSLSSSSNNLPNPVSIAGSGAAVPGLGQPSTTTTATTTAAAAASAASGHGLVINTTGSALNSATNANLSGLSGNSLPSNTAGVGSGAVSGGIANMPTTAAPSNSQLPPSISNISAHTGGLPNPSAALPSVSIAGMNPPSSSVANAKTALPSGLPTGANAAVAAATAGVPTSHAPGSANTPNTPNTASTTPSVVANPNSVSTTGNTVVVPAGSNSAVSGVVLPAGVQMPNVPVVNAANLPSIPVNSTGNVLPSVNTSGSAANVSGIVLPVGSNVPVPGLSTPSVPNGASLPVSTTVLPASGSNNDPSSAGGAANLITTGGAIVGVNAAITGPAALPNININAGAGLASASGLAVAGTGTGAGAGATTLSGVSPADPGNAVLPSQTAATVTGAGSQVLPSTSAHGAGVSQHVAGHVLPEGQGSTAAHVGHGQAGQSVHSAGTDLEAALNKVEKLVAKEQEVAAAKAPVANWLEQANAHLGMPVGHSTSTHGTANSAASAKEASVEVGNHSGSNPHTPAGVKPQDEPRIDLPSVSEGLVADTNIPASVRSDLPESRVIDDLSVIDNRILEVRQTEQAREEIRIEQVKEEAAQRYEEMEIERRRASEEAQERYEQIRRDELKRVEEERVQRETAEKERRLADEMAFMLVMRQRQETEEKERVLKQKQEREYFQELVRKENTQEKHVVRANEDVVQIAQTKFKDSRLADLIYEMNKGKIEVRWINGRRVYVAKVGQVLILPSQKQVREWLSRYDAISAKSQTSRGMASQTSSERQERREHIEKLLGKLQEEGKREGNRSYFVRLGDTLRSIAMKHPDLKDVTLWRLLAIKNGLTTDTDSKGAPLAVLIRGADLQIPTEEEIAQFKLALKGVKGSAATGQQEKSQPAVPSEICDRECQGCLRLVSKTARFCPACGFAFESERSNDTTFPLPVSTVPTTPFLSGGGKATPCAEEATTRVDGLAAAGDENEKEKEKDDAPDTGVLEDDRTTLSFVDGTVKVAPHAEPQSQSLTRVKDVLFDRDAIVKEVSSLIDKLNDNCRLIKAEKVVDGNLIHCQQLEVYVDEKWLPVLVYEVGDDASVRHEFTKDGRKKSIKIDLPAIAVDEMVKNELERNWQEYCKRYLAGRRLSA